MDLSCELPLVRALEERAFNAWPAQRTVLQQGWVLRMSGGYTKRANSANALAPEGDFGTLRAAVEEAYGRQGLPGIFRLTPLAPPGADGMLADAGYTLLDPTYVLRAPSLAAAAAHPAVRIDPRPSPAWCDGFARANGVPPQHRATLQAMVEAVVPQAGFAVLHIGDAPVGFGLGVVERGAVGLYDIVVAPDWRGRGHGRTLVGALLDWGRRQGAAFAYLQVGSHNLPARALYAGLGFCEGYAYHYRMPPALGPAG